MKTKPNQIGWLLGVMVLTLTLTQPGCQIFKPNPDPYARWESLARSASTIGGALYLCNHPQNREPFVTARDALAVLITEDQIDSETILRILQTLPIQSLESKEGRIIFASIVLVLEEVNGQIEVTTPEIAKRVAKGLVEGLTLALNLTE